MIYIYDGTWVGLCTALERITLDFFQQKEDHSFDSDAQLIKPLLLEQGRNIPDLFETPEVLTNDGARARQFRHFITTQYGRSVLHIIQTVFRVPDYDKESCIIAYLFHILNKPTSARSIQIPEVNEMVMRRRRVLYEVHLLFGIIRFKEIENGMLFATISPDNFVLDLIAPFFSSRFSKFCWVIYDEKRNWSAFWDTKKMKYFKVTDNDAQGYSDIEEPGANKEGKSTQEKLIQSLWKTYFKQVGIENRKNPKLQESFVPHRYRSNMTEFND